MVPLLALGLPTNATAAIIIAALMSYGIEPGPLLLTKEPDLVWMLIASLFIGNFFLLVLNLPLAPTWAKLLRIPRPYLYAGILFFASMGAYAVQGQPFDLYLLLALGFLGFAMRRFGLPVLPLIVGAILGPLFERHLRRSLQTTGGDVSGPARRPGGLGLLRHRHRRAALAARRPAAPGRRPRRRRHRECGPARVRPAAPTTPALPLAPVARSAPVTTQPATRHPRRRRRPDAHRRRRRPNAHRRRRRPRRPAPRPCVGRHHLHPEGPGHMTVLVGYVPTPLGEATLRAGVAESRRRAEHLLVVNMSRDDVLVDAHRAARDDLDRVERDVAELGVDVEVVRIEQGSDPADALVRVADERSRLGDRHRPAAPHAGGQAHHGIRRPADPARRPVPGPRRQGGHGVSVSTADLWDERGDALQSCSVQLRHYGGRTAFSGAISTVRCHRDNALVKAALAEPGEGRVLVVDGGGSLESALMGDLIAASAVERGWAGVVIHGAVRDVAALRDLPLGALALGSNPRKSAKDGVGERDVPVAFGGVEFVPGQTLVGRRGRRRRHPSLTYPRRPIGHSGYTSRRTPSDLLVDLGTAGGLQCLAPETVCGPPTCRRCRSRASNGRHERYRHHPRVASPAAPARAVRRLRPRSP